MAIRDRVTFETSYLPCTLTFEERERKGRELADLCAEADRLEGDKKSAAESFKAKQSTVDAKRREVHLIIRQGFESREVQCRRIMSYEAKRLDIVREDTGEVVSSRPLNPTEIRELEQAAQGRLFAEQEPEPSKPRILPADDEETNRKGGTDDPGQAVDSPGEVPPADTTAHVPGEAGAPAAVQTGEAATEPTPAGEAASPDEPPLSDVPGDRRSRESAKRMKKAAARQEEYRNQNEPLPLREPDARDSGYTLPDTEECAIVGCLCRRYVSTAKGICGRTGCGHEQGYHTGKPPRLDDTEHDRTAAAYAAADQAPGEPGDTNLGEQIDAGPDSGPDAELGF